MRKYLQITVVLGIFGLLVVFKHLRSGDDNKFVVTSTNIQNPVISPTTTPLPTDTPVPANASGSNTAGTQSQNAPSPTQAPVTPTPAGQYRDGTYTGSVADAFYGYIQVQAVISGGKITDVIFLQHPSDNGTSQYINSQAMPYLKQEAIAVQSANVNIISGASDSSIAFRQSLADALSQAR